MKIQIDTPDTTIVGVIADGTDLDSRFQITCEDTGERLWVNGWMVDIETLDDTE